MKGASVALLVVFNAMGAPHASAQITSPASSRRKVDPLTWIEPIRQPAFREVLKGTAFRARLAKAVARIGDFKKLQDSPTPDICIRVTDVVPNSGAAKAGLKVGDRILEFNGHKVWHAHAPYHINSDSPQQVKILNRASKEQMLAFPAGQAGLQRWYALNEWRNDLWFLRGKFRNPRWDKFVMVGILNGTTDPDLAETAWHHAIKNGYRPDQLTAYCGAWIADTQGRSNDALKFSSFVPINLLEATNPVPTEIEMVHRLGWAIADYKLEVFVDILVIKYPNRTNNRRHQHLIHQGKLLIDMHKSRSFLQRRLANPTALAVSLKKVDALADSVSFAHKGHLVHLTNAKAGKPFTMNAKVDFFTTIRCGVKRPMENAELLIKFSVKPNSVEKSKFAKQLVVEMSGRGEKGSPMAGMNLEYYPSNQGNTTVGTSIGNGARLLARSQTVMMDGKAIHEVRILKVGGQAEVFFNGKRVSYQPVDTEQKHIDVYIGASGVKAEIKEIKLFELVE